MIPNNWWDQFPDWANLFHDLIIMCIDTCLGGTENYGWEYCLDHREVRRELWKKWQTYLHWVQAGNRCVSISTSKLCALHYLQVKVHSLNEIFWLIVVLRTDSSPDPTISSIITISTIFSYSVDYGGTKESKPTDNDHCLFYSID